MLKIIYVIITYFLLENEIVLTQRFPTAEIITQPLPQTWHVQEVNKELSCDVNLIGRPSPVVWRKDGNKIDLRKEKSNRIQKLETRSGKVLTSTLYFKTVEKVDQGSYNCEILVGRRRLESQKAYVTVLNSPASGTFFGPPVIIRGPPPNYPIKPGELNLNIPCQYESNPPATKVTWDYMEIGGRPPQNGGKTAGIIIRPVSSPNLVRIPTMETARVRGVRNYKVFCKVSNSRGEQKSGDSILEFKNIPSVPVIVDVEPTTTEAFVNWKILSTDSDEKTTCLFDVTPPDDRPDLSSFMQNIDDASQGTGTYRLTLLKPHTTYLIKMRCMNDVGSSEWGNEEIFTTKQSQPSTSPSNIDISTVSTTAIVVSWRNISVENLNGFLIRYIVNLFSQSTRELDKEVATLPTTRNITIENLTPGETYLVQVAAETEAGIGPFSEADRITLPSNDGQQPPGIDIVEPGSTYVVITFVNVSDRDCNIKVTDEIKGNFETINIAGVKRHTVTGLMPYTKYYVRVKCQEQYGQIRHFMTGEGVPKSAPSIINITETEEHDLEVFWEEIDKNDLQGILLEYKVCASGKLLPGFSECSFFDSREKNIFIEGVFPQTKYTITMAACTKVSCGPSTHPPVSHFTSLWEAPDFDVDDGPSTGRIVGIVFAVFLVIFLIVIFLLWRKYREKKLLNSNNGMSVAYTAGAQGAAIGSYNSVPPSNGVTPNDYSSVRVSAAAPILSTEIMKKIFGVRIPKSALLFQDILGEGEFGSVIKAILKPYDAKSGELEVKIQKQVAVKSIKMELTEAGDQEEFISEGLRMKDLDHPHVMSLIGVCLPGMRQSTSSNPSSLSSNRSDIQVMSQSDLSPLVIIPYMPNGSLRNLLFNARSNSRMNEYSSYRLLRYASDISDGMQYLAEKNIVHRDLAARNCLLDKNYRVVVSDFGLSRKIYDESYYRQRRAARMPVKWMAIESLEDRTYTEKTDVWSFGVTFWEILTFCQNPYPGVSNHELCELLNGGMRLTKPLIVPDDVWRIISSCWDALPNERPSFVCIYNKMQALLLKYSKQDFEAKDNTYVNVPKKESVYEQEIKPVPPTRGSSSQSRSGQGGSLTPPKVAPRNKARNHNQTSTRRLLSQSDDDDDATVNL